VGAGLPPLLPARTAAGRAAGERACLARAARRRAGKTPGGTGRCSRRAARSGRRRCHGFRRLPGGSGVPRRVPRLAGRQRHAQAAQRRALRRATGRRARPPRDSARSPGPRPWAAAEARPSRS
jgi:hypothetical protein